ncbi:hypothetical protein BKA67DRAFT_539003 [Truncatella angustata]|uniref:Uncharacterized protein n=1 Tax=Truncatella angustata TaxID=152316 RepID=A0A9P8ZVS1_9PEZI|nr:uncharacterized protein BKA67DRAFT_539003 [Truncatella angustata]KAH6648999.1 hypothetical protein BKA67DRAFT_539003 [Truncatella angustata]
MGANNSSTSISSRLHHEYSEPFSVTVIGARFPADGSAPHLVKVATMPVSSGPGIDLNHVPDLRAFWKAPEAWRDREVRRVELGDPFQPWCNGLYLVIFSFACDYLPRNETFPPELTQPLSAHGDVFVFKLYPWEFAEFARAAYDSVPAELLQLPLFSQLQERQNSAGRKSKT